MTDSLGILFDSPTRIRMMRLFLFNEEIVFEKGEIARKIKSNSPNTSKELHLLEKSGMIKKRIIYKEGKKKADGSLGKKRKIQGYILNNNFRYTIPLQRLLVDSSLLQNKEILEKLSGAGKLKAVVVSGFFVQDTESRVDILVAGDDLNVNKIRMAISQMEAEIGKELKYAIFSTPDLKYRMGICDRLIRDIFDYPHRVIVDRIGLE
jgi:hypothetical protein